MEERGDVNQYICNDCANRTCTVNLAHGVTPFVMTCPHCDSINCLSRMYNLPNKATITRIWYRPRKGEFSTLSPDQKDHVRHGGLLGGSFPDDCGKQCVNDPIAELGLDHEMLTNLSAYYRGC